MTPRQKYRAIAALMVVWGVALFVSGLIGSLRRELSQTMSAIERSLPHLLIAGGSAVALVGLSLWVLNGNLLKNSSSLRFLQVIRLFSGGFVILTLGIGLAVHSVGRDPWIVALSTFALGVAISSRWLEANTSKALTSRNVEL